MFGSNWMTRVGGILSAVGLALSGVAGWEEWGKLIAAVGVFLLGIAAKGKNVTGGTIAATHEAAARVAVDTPPVPPVVVP